jgi:hypothetical protein
VVSDCSDLTYGEKLGLPLGDGDRRAGHRLHYTTGLDLARILTDGLLKPATAYRDGTRTACGLVDD